MSNQYTNPQFGGGGYASAVRLYMDSLDSWKEGYESLLRNSGLMPQQPAAGAGTSVPEKIASDVQGAGQAVFKRFVRQQIDLCRFFERRWEHYLNLPEQVARCRTPADLAQLQFNFINRMSMEYTQEGAKLGQQMQELTAGLMPGCAVRR